MNIAFLSRKGGVAKTTTAVNLSAALAHRGFRVLLADLDSQGSASLSLGVRRGDFAPSSFDLLVANRPAEEVIRPTSVPGLDLITSSVDLITIDHTLGHLPNRESLLKDRLQAALASYDFVFFDCPPALGLLPLSALAAADAYILPLVPQYLVLEGLDNFLDAIRRLLPRVGSRAELLGMLLTMADYRLKSTRKYVRAVRQHHGRAVFAVEVRLNVRLAEAPSHGQTIFQYDDTSTGAGAYRHLAEELLLRCRPPVKALADGARRAASPSRRPEGRFEPVPPSVWQAGDPR